MKMGKEFQKGVSWMTNRLIDWDLRKKKLTADEDLQHRPNVGN